MNRSIAQVRVPPAGDVDPARASPRVGVVGLGPVGRIAAELAVRAGLVVVGYDRAAARVAECASKYRRAPAPLFSNEAGCLAEADVIVVAVRLEVSDGGEADLEPLRDVATTLNALPPKPRLVVLESTVPPGVTRRFAEDWLRACGDARFLVAHCPDRLKVGDTADDLLRVPRLVGGVCPESTVAACEFLERLGLQPVAVSAPEVSELSKLLENVFLTVGIGLMGEITRLAHALSVNASEVACAAATKPSGYFPFRPGAGIGGHCLPNDLSLLRYAAAAAGVAAPLLDGANSTVAMLNGAVIDRLERMLEAKGICLDHSRIWIIGIGFKVGSDDLARTPAVDLIRELRRRNAVPVYSDSANDCFTVDGVAVERVHPDAMSQGIAAAIILAGDRAISLDKLDREIPVILDAGGANIMPGCSSRMQSL